MRPVSPFAGGGKASRTPRPLRAPSVFKTAPAPGRTTPRGAPRLRAPRNEAAAGAGCVAEAGGLEPQAPRGAHAAFQAGPNARFGSAPRWFQDADYSILMRISFLPVEVTLPGSETARGGRRPKGKGLGKEAPGRRPKTRAGAPPDVSRGAPLQPVLTAAATTLGAPFERSKAKGRGASAGSLNSFEPRRGPMGL